LTPLAPPTPFASTMLKGVKHRIRCVRELSLAAVGCVSADLKQEPTTPPVMRTWEGELKGESQSQLC